VNEKKKTEEHISNLKQRTQIAKEVSTIIVFISPAPGMFTSLLSPCNKKRHSNSAPTFLVICKKDYEQWEGNSINLITFSLSNFTRAWSNWVTGFGNDQAGWADWVQPSHMGGWVYPNHMDRAGPSPKNKI
jgi:hypothetical protein